MRQALLLGNPKTKRTLYLEKGAKDAGMPVGFWDWKDFKGPCLPPIWQGRELFIKIDPPVWTSCCLEELDPLTRDYEEKLMALERVGERESIVFLNTPRAIRQLLDKRSCKEKLRQQGIPATECLAGSVDSADRLLDMMERQGASQVFIKPVRGSGAAGIAAFRYQKRTGKRMLYTCGMEDPVTGRLVNTKRLRCFTDRQQVTALVDRLLKQDCIVERWYAKAQYQGYSYDLRAVVQDGQTDFMLARLSKGPITNLHLNNHPLKASELKLPPRVLEEIEELSKKAAGCYGGLRSAGLDILLEKGSLRPRVIEMNSQGDLIYQDIFWENKIYRRQAEMMKEWLEGE